MVTMIDEIFDRHYQAGREQMNAAIAASLTRFAHAIRNAFEVLVNIEYNAPWAMKARRVRSL